jgi:hypothetical protein
MTDLEKQVREALEKLGAQHGVGERAGVRAEEHAEALDRKYGSDATVERSARKRTGDAAPVQQGDTLRDRYATLDGKRRVYVHEARIKRDGIYKAYVMDLKTRERFWTLCSRLTDVTREK